MNEYQIGLLIISDILFIMAGYRIGFNRGFRKSGEALHEIAVLMWKNGNTLANFITELGKNLGKIK